MITINYTNFCYTSPGLLIVLYSYNSFLSFSNCALGMGFVNMSAAISVCWTVCILDYNCSSLHSFSNEVFNINVPVLYWILAIAIGS